MKIGFLIDSCPSLLKKSVTGSPVSFYHQSILAIESMLKKRVKEQASDRYFLAMSEILGGDDLSDKYNVQFMKSSWEHCFDHFHT